MLTFLSFILVVFPIIIFHEFAHFLVGKALGAEPEEFSVGFGKQIFNFQWLGANFRIGWIPLGGYVKFKKVQFDVEFGEGKKTGDKIAPWRWFFISLAGPVSNFILTFVIFWTLLFVAFQGIGGGVVKSSLVPGVNAGDKLLTIEEGTMTSMVKKTIGVTQAGNVFKVEDSGLTPVDVSLSELKDLVELSTAATSFSNTFSKTGMVAASMVVMYFEGTTKALGNLFTPKGYREIMGPVGIAGEAEKARSEGFISVLFLIASLSFAVGYFNLLPLSFFDGGRAVLALVEQVTQRPISMRILGHLNLVGLVLVVGLLLMGTTSDFLRLLGK